MIEDGGRDSEALLLSADRINKRFSIQPIGSAWA
jgi:hypothetical protein